MSEASDTELTQEMEALLSAKKREQWRSKGWFALALGMLLLAWRTPHHPWLVLGEAALTILSLWRGSRAHLRAGALRSQAMEKILAEAFRRAGQEMTP